ncbi:MAG: hypothetical protein PVJ16_02570 [Nitrosopumilaceae archaeon]
MSFKRPKIPKPKIPKVKKPTNSKRKKLDKTIKSEISKKITTKIKSKKTSLQKPKSVKSKKTTHKNKGICYSQKNCKGKIVSNQCTKTECKKLGGKSWKGLSGCQEVS